TKDPTRIRSNVQQVRSRVAEPPRPDLLSPAPVLLRVGLSLPHRRLLRWAPLDPDGVCFECRVQGDPEGLPVARKFSIGKFARGHETASSSTSSPPVSAALPSPSTRAKLAPSRLTTCTLGQLWRALNRDIGMDMAASSISQPSDPPGTLGALVTDSNSTTNQLIDEWQSFNQEDQTAHQTVQLEEHKDLQAQEQYLTSVEQPNHQQNAQQQQQIDSQSENENMTVLQENLSTDQHQLQKDQVVEKNQVSISQENSVQESQRDKLQHSEDQVESFVQHLNDQQTSTSDQGNSQMRPMKSGTIPFTILIPILRPNLDKDRSMQLEAVFAKLRSNDISKENFLRVIRNIIAAQNSQSGSSPQQLQASQQQTSRGAQHFVEGQSISHLHSLSSMQPQRGQTSTSVQQLVEVDVRPDIGSAKSNEVDNQSYTQGHHPAQVSSASMNVVKQEREVSLVSVQAVNKQQHHHPSSLLYGGTVNSHVFTRPPGSSSVTSKKSQSQGSQIRQLTPQGILPPQAAATQPTNMMNASMYEVQSTVTDANKHEGYVSHLTSHLSPLQSQVTWQSSTSKEQKASSLSTMSFVKQALVAEVTFSDKDMLLPTLYHNRPLYMQGKVNGHELNRILVDPGASVNIMPLKTFKSLYLMPYLQRVNNVRIAGFNQNSENALGKVEVQLVMDDFTTKAVFYIINATTPYKALLGRPWLHENRVIPSTLHQCIKYVKEGEQHIVFADRAPFHPNECNLADAQLYFGEPRGESSTASKGKGKQDVGVSQEKQDENKEELFIVNKDLLEIHRLGRLSESTEPGPSCPKRRKINYEANAIGEAINQSISCLLSVDNMYSGAAVEALTAALNRDIGMDMAAPSISQPSDPPGTLGALVTDSNSTTNQLIDKWQASNQEDQTAHQTVQLEEQKDLQAQEQYLTSVEQPNHQQNAQQQQQIDSQSENENLTVLQENLSTDQHQLQKDQVVEKNMVSISQENSVQESQQDKLQHSEDQQESFVQQLNDQQTSTSDQGNSPVRPMKSGSIPFTILIPILRPNLDKDRSMQLEAVFAKLRANDISKEDFLRVIKNIVGDQMLRQAAMKIAARNSQSGSRPQQLQASQLQTSRGAQHFVEGQSISHLHSLSSMQPQRGQTSTSVHQLVEESKRLATHQSQVTVSTVDVRPDIGCAKSNEVDNQSDSQGHHPAQVSSTSMNVVKQESEVSLVSVQAVNKQQHHHPSSLLYGGTVNSYVFTRPPGSSSVTSKKSQSQGSQIRQLTQQGILPPQAGATQPMNMMNASMYEVQSTVTDANKHEGSVSHLTSHLSPLQSQVTWQSSTSKEQKASSLSTMSFVKQEVAEQTVEQQNRPQFAALQGSFGTVQIDPESPALSSSKDEADEKQLSRSTLSSSASTMMTPQLESASQVLEGGE
ncbi:hypothetical protein Taro_018222, partial [Colocasia esculenta]|nr:hypothetical protein [Colocasia esculenta]